MMIYHLFYNIIAYRKQVILNHNNKLAHRNGYMTQNYLISDPKPVYVVSMLIFIL